jgi:hypothetical protein
MYLRRGVGEGGELLARNHVFPNPLPHSNATLAPRVDPAGRERRQTGYLGSDDAPSVGRARAAVTVHLSGCMCVCVYLSSRGLWVSWSVYVGG